MANGIPNVAAPSDTAAPSIAVAAPTEGAAYALGVAVDARYSCEDGEGGSGWRLCQGPVADGDTIDTGSTGSYGFNVTATDEAGNTTSLTHRYPLPASRPRRAAPSTAPRAAISSPVLRQAIRPAPGMVKYPKGLGWSTTPSGVGATMTSGAGVGATTG